MGFQAKMQGIAGYVGFESLETQLKCASLGLDKAGLDT